MSMFLLADVLFVSAIPAASAGEVMPATNIVAIQHEALSPEHGRYDWGAGVMLDGKLYRMWWVRLGGANQKRFPYDGPLPDGEHFEFTYPDYGDRIYYAESRDGVTWHIEGADYTGKPEDFGPDSQGPLMVLAPAESAGERMHLGCPSVIKVDGALYMYYEAPSEFVLKRNAEGKPMVGDEYQNQVFLATSPDGKTWHKWPTDEDPQPIVPAPVENQQRGRQRYGLGQPTICYRDGKYIMHYVDSCTGPGDFIVRIEADNPQFRNARPFARSLASVQPGVVCPAGAVARFAQIDANYFGDAWYLVRPAYGTGNLGLLVSRDGVFAQDVNATAPQKVFPQIATPDPRGKDYLERSAPRFLTDPHGKLIVRNGKAVVYYGSGLESRAKAWSWDLYRCEFNIESVARHR
jgi:hypothetical protein